MKHLESNNLLCETQYGFRNKHSCESQLLTTIDDFGKVMNDKLQVDIGILDFSKAFDKVPHARLLQKIDFYGIRGKLLSWIRSFLSNRLQRVVVDGSFSSPSEVTSGVPQGSVLGPTLFLLYINDLDSGIRSSVRLFADDCLIYRTIYSPLDHLILQEDLSNLSLWANKWQMKFNIDKCSILQMSNRQHKSSFEYSMLGSSLKTVEQHIYLGVQLHHKMSWHPHVNYICSKTNRLLGFLQRNLQSCPKYLREKSYKQFILPILEYCSTIWDPHHQCSIHQIEMLQHRAARFVLGRPWRRDNCDSITLMLEGLNWPSLELRRKCARLILLYKILNNYLIIPSSYLPLPSPITSTRSNHSYKFLHYQTSINNYKYSFFPRTVPDWNDLPESAVNSLTLEQFKESVYRHFHIISR